jgi:hypothetical protein
VGRIEAESALFLQSDKHLWKEFGDSARTLRRGCADDEWHASLLRRLALPSRIEDSQFEQGEDALTV